MTLLAELVRASQRVGATTARRTKVGELAWLLKSLASDEIDVGVHYLSGEIPQGKIGVGYAAVRAAAGAAASAVAVSGATMIASPAPSTSTAGSTWVR